jgi:hypothetical protein
MVVKGSNGKWRTALLGELEKQFEFIIKDSDARPAPEGEDAVAALTGWNRTRWAEAREMYFWEGMNKESLTMIEKAFCHIHMYDVTPMTGKEVDIQAQAKSLLHGDGKSLWFDKSVTFGTYPNGKAGLHAEHSYADALTVAHMWEWVTTEERMAGGMYREDGHCKDYDAPLPPQWLKPMRAKWNLAPECKDVITQAVTENNKLCDDLDLVIMTHSAFGKGFMKKARISPDAFFQLAMQLAYKRDSQGKRALTYEASVTRLFAQGRTETVRSLSNESAAALSLATRSAGMSQRRLWTPCWTLPPRLLIASPSSMRPLTSTQASTRTPWWVPASIGTSSVCTWSLWGLATIQISSSRH